VRARSDKRVRVFVEELAGKPQPAGGVEHKVAAFYGSYTDVAAIDKAGLAPLQSLLASIDALKTPVELSAWMGKAQGEFSTPVLLWVMPDFKDPTTNRALTWQGGLGMPDRDYYLRNDERFAATRKAYNTYIARLFALGNQPEPLVACPDRRVDPTEAQGLLHDLVIGRCRIIVAPPGHDQPDPRRCVGVGRQPLAPFGT